MTAAIHYDRSFFNRIEDGARRSAREVVPLLIDLVKPRSVIDVGCGEGTWLSVFQENGIEDILGIDGDWVETRKLQISAESFLSRDLAIPLKLDRTFDLVLSLEVAEHLESRHAADFVASLVGLGPVVAFSAAIPLQGGNHHVNEQWPDYWSNLFEQHDYGSIDCIRPAIWNNHNVEFWYKQNLIVYVDKRAPDLAESLRRPLLFDEDRPLRLVHPDKYLDLAGLLQDLPCSRYALKHLPDSLGLGTVLRALPRMMLKSIRSRLKRLVRGR